MQQAVVATESSKSHPWPIESFLTAHPLALKFVQENRVVPASFANEAFFSNDAFVFINRTGIKKIGRYKILPIAGQRHLSEAEANAKPTDFLTQELKTRLPKQPLVYRLVVQLPDPGDATQDPSLVWPDNRKTIELGAITVDSVVPESESVEQQLAFDPTNLTDGIQLSDDPLPALRSRVYALSVKHRHQK